jgi:hypothetical protein
MVMVTTIEEPPVEKKGSGIPVAGTNPETTAMLKSACETIAVVSPKAR